MNIPPGSPRSTSPVEKKFEPDEDVDVEQCSDGEDESASKQSLNGHPDSRSPGGNPSSNNNEDKSSGRENSSNLLFDLNVPPYLRELHKYSIPLIIV